MARLQMRPSMGQFVRPLAPSCRVLPPCVTRTHLRRGTGSPSQHHSSSHSPPNPSLPTVGQAINANLSHLGLDPRPLPSTPAALDDDGAEKPARGLSGIGD